MIAVLSDCCCDEEVVLPPPCYYSLSMHDGSYWDSQFTIFDGSSEHSKSDGKGGVLYRVVSTNKYAYAYQFCHYIIYKNGSPLDPFFCNAEDASFVINEFYNDYAYLCSNLSHSDSRGL